MTMSSSISSRSNRSSTTSSSARSSFIGDNTISPPPITAITITSSSSPSLPSAAPAFYEFRSSTHLPDHAATAASAAGGGAPAPAAVAPTLTPTTLAPAPAPAAEGATDDEFPNGIYTELTFCYSPTCIYDDKPCYSYYCPKQIAERVSFYFTLFSLTLNLFF